MGAAREPGRSESPGARPQRFPALGLRASGELSWSWKGTRAGAAPDTSAKAAASAGGKQLCWFIATRAVCCLHLRAARGVRRPP